MYHIRALACVALVLFFPMLSMAQLLNCTALPDHNATSVYSLRPNDIKVVMAMGDSFTTGFGIKRSANESFGFSFSMGGDTGAISLATYLQYFDPYLLGASRGTFPAEVCYGFTCPTVRYNPNQVNNAAKSGAMVADMATVQSNYLIRQLNLNPFIDVQNDWKVLTIMSGINDLCASCTFNLPYLEADDYENNLMATLERVRQYLPRTFVNLVANFNISQAYELSLTASRCSNISRPLFVECDCIFQPGNGAIREIIDSRLTQFNERLRKVAAYYQSEAYDNFAVVVQPFATNTYISDLPNSFLSHLDCFHPSKTGQQAMAVALWNNMLTPASSKKTTLDFSDTPICPTADTILYTY